MGEYAIRKKDRQQVKIGSCESMYYCRYEQLKDIEYNHPTMNLLWRIPAPNEDGIEPGEFPFGFKDKHGYINNQLRLIGLKVPDKQCLLANPGLVQAKVEDLGLLINVHCLHGLQLPENTESTRFFFNGKHEALHLSALKNTETELLVCFSCAACGETWSCRFDEIEPAIEDLEMKLRLFHQCSEYYYTRNEGASSPYAVRAESKDGGEISLICNGTDDYTVYSYGFGRNVCGTWEEMRNLFISQLPSTAKEGHYSYGRYLQEKYLTPKTD